MRFVHDIQVRRPVRGSLRAFVLVAFAAGAIAMPVLADDSASILLHLAPGHYQRTEKLVHLVKYQMSKTLKNMVGSRANDQTILEDRAQVLTLGDGGTLSETETNSRRFAGDHPKDPSTKVRTIQYEGKIAPNGTRTPARDVLEDAGDGALDQLPDVPLTPGQTWTFSRRIKTDRELGEGTMTYTDKLTSVQDRGGHRIATIAVNGVGRVLPASDMQAKGFKEATMTFSGTAEFDVTAGLPGVEHYTGTVTWGTKVMWTHIGVVFDDTYDATPLVIKS